MYDQEQLYDLVLDPNQRINQIANDSYLVEVSIFRHLMRSYLQDSCPVDVCVMPPSDGDEKAGDQGQAGKSWTTLRVKQLVSLGAALIAVCLCCVGVVFGRKIYKEQKQEDVAVDEREPATVIEMNACATHMDSQPDTDNFHSMVHGKHPPMPHSHSARNAIDIKTPILLEDGAAMNYADVHRMITNVATQ
eukprot:CAMPEP_0197070490 /NCGR_PEP_ID=MMETSP1384-20130603/200530_1 /TAXON_ID=29189 /ORGANISM="Ammonia sp." /LENGTH=190 /DNA_ID=CAMNT_0042508891 /DNA_START=190 /DNA_END=762 /DNA_ORIENTATION=+